MTQYPIREEDWSTVLEQNVTTEEVPSLVSAVREAFDSGRTRPLKWRKQQLRQLQKLFEENIDAFVKSQAADFGRSAYLAESETRGRAAQCAETLENIDDWIKPVPRSVNLLSYPGSGYSVYEPYGVILVMGAWNFPLALTIDPAVGAIAAGNAVIMKLPEHAANTSNLLASLIPKYMDTDAIKVCNGGVPVAQALLKERYDYIAFTGSSTVGKIVLAAAAPNLTPCLLELGGKSPVYVAPDADLDLVASRVTWGKYMNAGQVCIAPDYLLVHSSIKNKLIAKIKYKITQFYGVDPEKSVDYDHLIDSRHVKRLQGLLEGQNLVAGGTVTPSTRYIAPTIVNEPDPESPLMQEEIFGPIMPVLSVESEREAIEFINKRDKPLVLYVFTKDLKTKQRFQVETSSGAYVINDCFVHSLNDELPFGGVGASGLGAYHGKHTFATFSHSKSVLDAATFADPDARYPPYTPSKVSTTFFLLTFTPSRIARIKKIGGVVLLSLLAILFRRQLRSLFK
eukprot:TRINITY_DN10650_c0_g1_i1.p1 TRINITY_DN10650_c0_g1~~TRINITY_DN10650_c0_g1_i1.p1  ORF type:complete len:511 (+),score=87.48 TRINITY_DN10650_c0_g1_i1:22-1554(+)